MDFKRDELVLNIAEPESLIVGNAIHLVLELWDQGAWQEDILGRGEVPVLPFMDSPGEQHARWLVDDTLQQNHPLGR